MPGFEHEFPLWLIREMEGVLRTLLEYSFSSFQVGVDEPLDEKSGIFTEITPVEYRADAVFAIGDPVSRIVVIEVQRTKDPKKPQAWTQYWASLFAKHGVPVEVLVIATTDVVGRWAKQPIYPGSGICWTPTVISPSSFRFDGDMKRTEYAELVLLAMYLQEDPEVIPQEVAVQTTRWIEQTNQLAEDDRRLYRDIVRHSVTKLTRTVVEKMMSVQQQKYEHRIFRKAYGDGRAEGIAEGREAGVMQATRESLYMILESRGLSMSRSQRKEIDSCDDHEALQRWVRQASTANSTDEALR